MGNDNKMKSTRNGKKTDGKFRSKHINHNPDAESTRTVFGRDKPESQENK